MIYFCCRFLSHPNHCLIDWEENPFLNNTYVKCSNGIPISTLPTETSLTRSFGMGHWWGTSFNMLRTVEGHGPSIWRSSIRHQLIGLWHVLPETWKELEELKYEEEIHYSLNTSKDSWRHSTLRLSEEMKSLRCNNADIDWYVRMPTNLKIWNATHALWGRRCHSRTFPVIDNCLPQWNS